MSGVLISALALFGAFLTGLAGRTLRGGLYAGLVLLLSLPLLFPDSGHMNAADSSLESAPFPPVQLTELILPDLWQPLPAATPNLITLALNKRAPSLQSQSLEPSREGRLYVSLGALCLAMMALVGVRGRTAWMARVFLAFGLLLACLAPGTTLPEGPLLGQWNANDLGLLMTCLSLATLAGLGLGSLKPLQEHDPVAAALFIGALVVILFAGLGAWAAWAGSSTPQQIVEPFLERLDRQGALSPSPQACSATAAHLVRVLDQGALAALAAMVALLVHLKGRRLHTAVLIFTITAGELLFAAQSWPFH